MRNATLALLVLVSLSAAPLRAAERPDLVVVISVDQLRADLIDRFSPWFSQRGFNRFLKSGATFPNTNYPYAATFTGPGHAAIGTGVDPAHHGIVGNNWFEWSATADPKMWQWYFDDGTPYVNAKAKPAPAGAPEWWRNLPGSPRYCAYDASVKVSAGTTSAMSPALLRADTLGDRVKAHSPKSRVMAVAVKDRAAILMAGRKADAVYWFDYRLPGFISSSWYRFDEQLLTAFNRSVTGYVPATAKWTQSSYIPADKLAEITFDPPAAWPLKVTRYEGTFPHTAKDPRGVTYTPFAHDMVLDFARELIATEALGTNRGAPDVLYVGLSATDYIGHYYGPDSLEAADNMVRLDRSLEAFFDVLERRFGNRVLVALTADHGVQPNPEILKLQHPGIDAGRLDLRNAAPEAHWIADLPPARIEMERAVAKKLGLPFFVDAPLSHAIVLFFEEPSLYLNRQRIEQLKLDPARVRRAMRDVVKSMKKYGINEVWTRDEMLAPDANDSRLEVMMRRSFQSARSGDVFITLRPNWIWTWGANSTTHGQPVENDTDVPLLFWGAAVKPGSYPTRTSPLDLASTIGALLGVERRDGDGQVLPCL